MADSTITNLNPLGGADAQPLVDVLAVADVSTAETKKIKIADVVAAGITYVADGSISGVKLTPGTIPSAAIGAGNITSIEIADGSVSTAKLAINAVTASKIAADTITATQIAPNAISSSELANNSVDTAAIQDQAVTNVKIEDGAITAAKIATGAINSTAIADGGINTEDLANDAINTVKLANGAVTTSKLNDGSVDNTKLADNAVTSNNIVNGAINASKLADDLDGSEFLPQSPNVVLAGPSTGANATPGFRQLVANDLPVVPAAKLPISSSFQLGAVQVGTGLTANAGGVISISNAVAAGTGSKITFNSNGLITAAVGLTAADIPALDASKIATGTLNPGQIQNRSITKEQLGNLSVAYIQEANPGISADAHVGMFWYQESTAGLHMYNGNSWMPVSIGRLSQENLRYCGTVNATTGLILGITPFGVAAGYAIGSTLGVATDQRTGAYFVVEVAGSGILETPGINYDVNDWVLCNGAAQGWIRIDVAGGTGGGIRLEDLMDVNITSPPADSLVALDAGTNQWVDVQLVDGGTY